MPKDKDNKPIDPTAPVPSESALPLRWVRVSHKTPDHIATRYLYAGYGSNLALTQMGRRCPGVDIIGPGLLRNARLVFARYLGIVQDESSTVPVGVYKCTAADVAALDRYEGLGRAYERILVTVECNGVAVRCFTYLKKDNEPEEPSERYYDTCLAGYNDWQFDTRRLRHARDHARKNYKPRKVALPYWWRDQDGTYRSDEPLAGDYEPLGSGTAAEYNRQQIARRAAANRSPRPNGGRLGGNPNYGAPGRHLDERLSVKAFKEQVDALRGKPVIDEDPTRTSKLNGKGDEIFMGRDGQRWRKNPNGHGWIRATDKE